VPAANSNSSSSYRSTRSDSKQTALWRDTLPGLGDAENIETTFLELTSSILGMASTQACWYKPKIQWDSVFCWWHYIRHRRWSKHILRSQTRAIDYGDLHWDWYFLQTSINQEILGHTQKNKTFIVLAEAYRTGNDVWSRRDNLVDKSKVQDRCPDKLLADVS